MPPLFGTSGQKVLLINSRLCGLCFLLYFTSLYLLGFFAGFYTLSSLCNEADPHGGVNQIVYERIGRLLAEIHTYVEKRFFFSNKRHLLGLGTAEYLTILSRDFCR